MDVPGSFDSLNAFILRGDPVTGMDNIFDSLMKNSLDEHDALYGLVARAVRISPDKLTYQFLLRKEARFHDGSPLTAKDAAFSLDLLKTKGHPRLRLLLRDMVSATPEADDVLTVVFAARAQPSGAAARRRPADLLQSLLRQKAFRGDDAASRRLGPDPTRSAASSRAASSPSSASRLLGQGSAGPMSARTISMSIRYDYFADRAVAFEGFKAGAYTVHEEFKSATWATGYDFPAIREGFVVRETIPDENISGIQGWFFNIRRPALKDPRIREAIGDCFDFAWTNKNLMYGAYQRTTSYFENSDMAAKGPPDAAGTGPSRAVPRQTSSRVFGEPYHAAAIRWIGPGPHAFAQRQRPAPRRGLQARRRRVGAARRQALHARVPQ